MIDREEIRPRLTWESAVRIAKEEVSAARKRSFGEGFTLGILLGIIVAGLSSWWFINCF